MCEAIDDGFPATIVRPSYTYGETWVPCSVGGHGYTVVDRIRRGKPIISHGDGQSLWVLTHASDFALGFVGLFGIAQALGECRGGAENGSSGSGRPHADGGARAASVVWAG